MPEFRKLLKLPCKVSVEFSKRYHCLLDGWLLHLTRALFSMFGALDKYLRPIVFHRVVTNTTAAGSSRAWEIFLGLLRQLRD